VAGEEYLRVTEEFLNSIHKYLPEGNEFAGNPEKEKSFVRNLQV
jgi:hypothetical protein